MCVPVRHLQSLICTAAYILGEFGRLITDSVPAMEQFKLLHAAFPQANPLTKGARACADACMGVHTGAHDCVQHTGICALGLVK